jgi:hypothetical protein
MFLPHLSMFLTENFDVPVFELLTGLHFLFTLNKSFLNRTPDMKRSPASRDVTLDAGTLRLITDGTLNSEPGVVKLSTKSVDRGIVLFKPDLVVPVDAYVVNPFFALQVNHRSTEIIAQHAHRQLSFAHWSPVGLLFLQKMTTTGAVPWTFVVRVLLIQVTSVAVRMHDDETKVADAKWIKFFVVFRKADVTAPVVFDQVLSLHDHREHSSRDQYCRGNI